MLDTFMSWWNWLARKNGEVMFRNRREAAEFVRRIANEGGPNQAMMDMRAEYEAVKKAKAARDETRLVSSGSAPLRQSEVHV